MNAIVNLLIIVSGFVLTYVLVRFPERFVDADRTRRLLIWQYRKEFPGRLWMIIAVWILQPIFALTSLALFFYLLGVYFSGVNTTLLRCLLIFAIPIFFLGFLVPVGFIEMVAGHSIQVWGGLIRFLGVRIDDDYRKCGLARILIYCISLVLLFVSAAVLRNIYG